MAISSEEKSILMGVFTTLAVTYLLLRFLLFCIPAGNIYEASTEIWAIIQQCPDKEYDTDVSTNIENKINLHPHSSIVGRP